jgi:hypothetical protein
MVIKQCSILLTCYIGSQKTTTNITTWQGMNMVVELFFNHKYICTLVIIKTLILIFLASLTCLQEWKDENKQDQNVEA